MPFLFYAKLANIDFNMLIKYYFQRRIIQHVVHIKCACACMRIHPNCQRQNLLRSIFFDSKITMGFLASTVELKGNLLDIELLVYQIIIFSFQNIPQICVKTKDFKIKCLGRVCFKPKFNLSKKNILGQGVLYKKDIY